MATSQSLQIVKYQWVGGQRLTEEWRMDLIAKNLFKIELEDGDYLRPKCFLDDTNLEDR